MFLDTFGSPGPNAVDNAGVPSAYGTMGQGGNDWEWNETAIGSSCGLRGGSAGPAVPATRSPLSGLPAFHTGNAQPAGLSTAGDPAAFLGGRFVSASGWL